MSITDVSTKTLIIPALKRDFKEGALYDARSEQIVTGYSLWNAADLKKIEAIRNDDTVYSINASDSLSEKFMGVDITGSVQLSILSGLIELGKGSVETVMKTKNTVGASIVQVKCFYKTGYKEMDMKLLRNIRYLDVARTGHNNTATHFVMKIQYGAGAIFTFTKEFQSGEDEIKVKAELETCSKNIQSAVLNGSFEGNYRNYSSSSQIKCEFKSFGLSPIEKLPTTYDEAVRFAGNFGRMAHRSMARQGGEALGIPCIVWLHPLVLLPGCADAPKLYWDFTPDQACQWVKFFEDCDTFELKMSQSESIMKQRTMISDVIGYVCWMLEVTKIFGIPNVVSTTTCFDPKIDLNTLIRDSYNNRDETEKKFRDELDRKKEFVTQLRSESKTKLREMLVEIRSGTKTFEYFQEQTKSFTNRLYGLSE